jgi:hypothetical protein
VAADSGRNMSTKECVVGKFDATLLDSDVGFASGALELLLPFRYSMLPDYASSFALVKSFRISSHGYHCDACLQNFDEFAMGDIQRATRDVFCSDSSRCQ